LAVDVINASIHKDKNGMENGGDNVQIDYKDCESA
jgi:hypothetical protein